MLERVTQGQSGKVTLKQLIGKGTSAEQNYNDWSAGRQFLFVNEAKDVSRDDFYNGYETFKDLVDTSTHSVRSTRSSDIFEKRKSSGMPNFYQPHRRDFKFPANDRRIAVFTNTDKPRGTSYYERLLRRWRMRSRVEFIGG